MRVDYSIYNFRTCCSTQFYPRQSYRVLSKQLEVLDPYEFVKLQLELNPTRYGTRYFNVGEDSNGQPYKYQNMDDYLGVTPLARISRILARQRHPTARLVFITLTT